MIWTFGDFSITWDDDSQTGKPSNIKFHGFDAIVAELEDIGEDVPAWEMYITFPDSPNRVGHLLLNGTMTFQFNEAEEDSAGSATLQLLDGEDGIDIWYNDREEHVEEVVAFINKYYKNN